jgi:hypothetical protein
MNNDTRLTHDIAWGTAHALARALRKRGGEFDDAVDLFYHVIVDAIEKWKELRALENQRLCRPSEN